MASSDHPPQPPNNQSMSDEDDSGKDDEVVGPNNKRRHCEEGVGKKLTTSWMKCPSKSGTSNLSKHLKTACKAFKVWQAANLEKSQNVFYPDGVGGELRLSIVSESVVRKASNELLFLAELPLSFMECLAWRHFCAKVQLYKPHSRRTATRDIVELFVKRKAAMKKVFGENKQRLSLTTDIWVAPYTGNSYMVITAHYIDAW
ncbi:PREDICTED: uncharacterized protein LOC104709567 [Camelina sativa]|uniref:Uncharacterized protein LOC104709567 n=1 Tax=Camelina sativa TaxID=90675 RepID=A0ABM0TCZ6_CAMSA|nr:PREDICTED: uncharacterized protein LOC104709567 [Camelina sativa]